MNIWIEQQISAFFYFSEKRKKIQEFKNLKIERILKNCLKTRLKNFVKYKPGGPGAPGFPGIPAPGSPFSPFNPPRWLPGTTLEISADWPGTPGNPGGPGGPGSP